MEPSLAAFLGIAVLVIVTPGPDTALTIRNTLGGGRRGGLGTALGVASGQAVWTVATSAGIAALLVASTSVFAAIRLAGAAYLVWLGAQALWVAWRGDSEAGPAGARGHSTPLPWWAAFWQGVLSNLGNPKMAVFFTSLLPQFTPAGRAAFPALLALGLLFCVMTLAWLAAYAVVVERAGDVLRRLGVRRVIEAVTGLLSWSWARASRSIAASRPATAGTSVARGCRSPAARVSLTASSGRDTLWTRGGAVPSRARQDRRRHLMKGGSCAIASR
jgi:threonine/homoserine/homoserine lactone efflux protein